MNQQKEISQLIDLAVQAAVKALVIELSHKTLIIHELEIQNESLKAQRAALQTEINELRQPICVNNQKGNI